MVNTIVRRARLKITPINNPCKRDRFLLGSEATEA
jgi:hypothetical protein